MTVRYVVTFEFEIAPPITHRGTVAASTMPTCFARAAREAVKANPNKAWTSMVCVLLERLDTKKATTNQDSKGEAVC
jgi:hypothetical protein